MGVGEMVAAEFIAFLSCTLKNTTAHCRDGAILYVCMDWRHMAELSAAGRQSNLDLKNLCVWNKTNGGMGSDVAAIRITDRARLGVTHIGDAFGPSSPVIVGGTLYVSNIYGWVHAIPLSDIKRNQWTMAE